MRGWSSYSGYPVQPPTVDQGPVRLPDRPGQAAHGLQDGDLPGLEAC